MADTIMLVLILALVGGFAFLQVRALKRAASGTGKLIASLPSIALAVGALIIVIGVSQDPTSHNLWPFELLMWIGGGLAYFAVLALVRRLSGPKKAVG